VQPTVYSCSPDDTAGRARTIMKKLPPQTHTLTKPNQPVHQPVHQISRSGSFIPFSRANSSDLHKSQFQNKPTPPAPPLEPPPQGPHPTKTTSNPQTPLQGPEAPHLHHPHQLPGADTVLHRPAGVQAAPDRAAAQPVRVVGDSGGGGGVLVYFQQARFECMQPAVTLLVACEKTSKQPAH